MWIFAFLFAASLSSSFAQDPRQGLQPATPVQVRWIRVGVGPQVAVGQCPGCFRWLIDTRLFGGHYRSHPQGQIAVEISSEALLQYRQARHWQWDRVFTDSWLLAPLEVHRFGNLQPGFVFRGVRWGTNVDESQREVFRTVAQFSFDLLFNPYFDLAVLQGVGAQGLALNTAATEWRGQLPTSVRMRWRTRYFQGFLDGTAAWPFITPTQRTWWQSNQFEATADLRVESARFLGMSMHLGAQGQWIYDGLRAEHALPPSVFTAIGMLTFQEVTTHALPRRSR